MWPQASHLIFLGLSVFYHEIRALIQSLRSLPGQTVLHIGQQDKTCIRTSVEGWGLGWGEDENRKLLFQNPLSLLHCMKRAATFSLQPSACQTSKSVRKDAAGKLIVGPHVFVFCHCPSFPLFTFIYTC